MVDSPSEPRPAAHPAGPGTTPPDDAGRLLVSCPDRPGVVAAVTGLLARWGANITESQQYTTDPRGGRFFLRLEFVLDGLERRLLDLENAFAGLAAAHAMDWRITRAAPVKRLAVLVSKADHALAELIWRRRYGDLRADIAMVISNHRDLEGLAHAYGLPFHHIPVTPDTKPAAEEAQLELIAGQVDAVVLARYMQILSGDLLRRLPCPAINIHHSFLPAFVGADPYGAAARRGVKLIGATAHYVTEELDAGPIIEQDVRRVDHRYSAAELKRAGRYVEREVLARAVSWHVDDRVIVHGNKTIVFG
ncbi:MAG: formyltetrahydrofolate deformylase [Streptosporangiales bacterium]|nr:formyltetrahydrofolate deformylase [Streptosporangiales bacterium]